MIECLFKWQDYPDGTLIDKRIHSQRRLRRLFHLPQLYELTLDFMREF